MHVTEWAGYLAFQILLIISLVQMGIGCLPCCVKQHCLQQLKMHASFATRPGEPHRCTVRCFGKKERVKTRISDPPGAESAGPFLCCPRRCAQSLGRPGCPAGPLCIPHALQRESGSMSVSEPGCSPGLRRRRKHTKVPVWIQGS